MKLIFAHIPKTAGTSVRVYLLPVFPRERTVYVAYVGGVVGPDKFSGHQLAPDWQFLSGHIRMSRLLANPGIDPSDPEIVLLSFVRDPVERLVSLYNYALAKPKHQPGNHKLARTLGPEGFIRRQEHDVQSAFLSGNGQEIAWKIMIAPVSRVEEACNAAIVASTGKPPRKAGFPTRNVSAGQVEGTISKSDLSPEFIAELYEKNARDMKIFRDAEADGMLTALPG